MFYGLVFFYVIFMCFSGQSGGHYYYEAKVKLLVEFLANNVQEFQFKKCTTCHEHHFVTELNFYLVRGSHIQ